MHPLIILSEPDSLFAERIRILRAFVLHQHHHHQVHSFLLTSCWPGEGKTSVCLNLAVALAEFGLRVLVVDTDARHGALKVMKSQASVAGLTLLTPSQLLDPAQALTEPDFLGSVRQAVAEHDIALTDTPSLSLCSDAHLCRPWVQAALMVVGSRRFRGVAEGEYCEDLRDQGIPVIGCVVTGD